MVCVRSIHPSQPVRGRVDSVPCLSSIHPSARTRVRGLFVVCSSIQVCRVKASENTSELVDVDTSESVCRWGVIISETAELFKLPKLLTQSSVSA